MRKVKWIVHETYQGKRKSEDVFAAVFLSNAAALTPNTHSGIIKNNCLHLRFPGKNDQQNPQRHGQGSHLYLRRRGEPVANGG